VKKSEFSGIARTHLTQPLGGERQRLVPFDLPEFAAPALTGAQQRFHQTGGRIMLHDAGRAFGAQHTAIDRVIAVTLDIADLRLAVFAGAQMHIDAAAAGAHVAGGLSDVVGHMRRKVHSVPVSIHRTSPFVQGD